MRVLITGSSGQIGTNLALRLLGEGHQVFGVDKRLNGWTDDFRYLLQDLSGHYAAMAGRDRRRRVPGRGRRRPSRRPRQGAPARPRARPRAREHDDDVQRARVLPADADPDHLQLEPRGVRRRPPLPDRGGHAPTSPMPRARTPPRRSRARRSSTRTRAATSCPTSCSASPTSTAGTTTTSARMIRVIPLFTHRILRGEPITVFGGERQGARLHVRRRLRRGDRPRASPASPRAACATRRSTSPTARATRSSGSRS